jgi:uncharacterized protein (DUF1697 family)
MAVATYIGFIRAIGPLTHPKMPMAGLRTACTAAGFADVKTVLATGNLLFRSGEPRAQVLAKLQKIVNGFGLDNAVVLRTLEELAKVVADNPLADAAEDHPSALTVFFLAEPAKDADWLTGYPGPERLSLSGLDLYVDYPANITLSKLAPAKVEKRLGVTTTFRNWNTVAKLAAAGAALEAEG